MEIVLGTANFGLPYGKALRRDLPPYEGVARILDCARSLGVQGLDTAAAYGASEERIGRYLRELGERSAFRISTKARPDLATSPEAAREMLREALEASKTALSPGRLDQFLLHRWEHRHLWAGVLWSDLLQLKEEGAGWRLGASVQGPEEASEALGSPGVETVQIACNILDWRYDEPELARLLAETAEHVRIEVRSVFLQGLLAMPEAAVFPDIGCAYDAATIRGFLREASGDYAGGHPAALCLRYVAGLPWARALVIGVDTPEQLELLVEFLSDGPFEPDVIAEIRNRRPHVPQALLDPAKWL
jgi:aryl-alcohol dehydrogenase-like predicted oxidoreductase